MDIIETLYRCKRRIIKSFIRFKKLIKCFFRKYFSICDPIHTLLSDKCFIKLQYKERLNKKLDLHNPVTFNEKLNWLKLYNRNPLYTTLVDKYAVKDCVAKLIGDQYIIPTLGVWKDFDEIDFDKLPNQFVLKCTHDSHSIVLCKDKSSFDYEKAKLKLNSALSENYYCWGREWPYKNVPPRIIAEKYMENSSGETTTEYKIYCFDGEAKIIRVFTEYFTSDGPHSDFYDLDWKHLDMRKGNVPNSGDVFPKPAEFDRLLELAKDLSKGIPHVRVDFCCWDSKLYFNEFTFFESGGYPEWHPEEWDTIMGNWLKLPKKNR